MSLEEFIEYYNHISCTIDRDDYFELMMRNSWKIFDQPSKPSEAFDVK